jgi:uncharacterized integral membrane protein
MPWRLILFIVVFAVFLAFITFNLDNRCDVNFFFNMGIKEVPVFLTVFASFILGLFCSLPLALFHTRKKKKVSPMTDKKTKKPDDSGKGSPESGQNVTI